MNDAQLTRLTVNLTPKAADALAAAASRERDSRTDTVNRALIVYDMITREKASGVRVKLESNDGSLHELVIL